jgi:hypothetical protein
MHVRVDGAGDHIEAPGADLAPAAQAVGDGRDPLAVDADIGSERVVRGDELAVPDD